MASRGELQDDDELVESMTAAKQAQAAAKAKLDEAERFLAELYRSEVDVVREGSERELLGLRIRVASAPPLDELIERLGGATAQPKKRSLKIA